MLSIYFSIFIVLLVAAAFFCVCFVMVCGLPDGAALRAWKNSAARMRRRAPAPPREESRRTETAAVPSGAKAVSDATQIFDISESGKEALRSEATRVFETASLSEAYRRTRMKQPASPAFEMEPEPEVLEKPQPPEVLEEYFVRHFLNQYGAVSRTAAQDTRTVTHHLIECIRSLDGRDAGDVLMHIMVQEALQNAQRTYVMLPNETVLAMVCDAFRDVAQGRKSDTRTILAYDALRVMPRMEMGQFRALGLLLLFHYSRNVENVDAEALSAYAARYVEPLMKDLPDEYSGYQQLEYLHCLSLENKDIAFGQVLRDSYPLIFCFRGCMKAELDGIRGDWPKGSLAKSLFNSYWKAAVIDDSLLPEYFEHFRITDGTEQMKLAALLHSRPAPYDRKEMERILEEVSPALSALQKTWDGSLLRRSSLTLMGMYIAQIFLREAVGEEFDLSHWM